MFFVDLLLKKKSIEGAMITITQNSEDAKEGIPSPPKPENISFQPYT